MKIQAFNFVLVLSVLFFSACEEDEVSGREYPRIKTLPVTEISSAGAVYNAQIIFRGDFEVLTYGFVWSEEEFPTLASSDRVIYSDNIQTDFFSQKIESTLQTGTLYYVRAFIETDDFLVYGATESFESKGSNSPAVNSINPSRGTVGDTIMIHGVNFSFIESQNKVMFNDLAAEIVLTSDSLLQAVVPSRLTDAESAVSVSVLGNTSGSQATFTLTTPNISQLSPNTGTDFTLLTITGDGFSSNPELNAVYIGDKEAEVTASEKTKVTVIVPPGIAKKENDVSVIVAERVGLAANPFIMNAPTFTAFYPKQASIREQITLEGANFSTLLTGNLVFFDSARANVIEATAERLIVEVPYGVPINSRIRILTAEQEASLADPFQIQLPEVSSPEPLKGTAGIEVMLTGTNFSPTAADNIVLFNAIPAEIVRSTKNAIHVLVPDGLNTRDTEISVSTGGHEAPVVSFEFVSGEWSNAGQFPADKRLGAMSFVIGNTLYTGLGEYSKRFSDVWSFDAVTQSWAQLSDFPGEGRSFPVSFSLNGKGYVGLGSTKEGYLNDFWEYDPVSDSWTQLQDFPGDARYLATSFAINGHFYVGQGQTRFDTFSDFYRYDISSDSWTMVAGFPGQSRSSTASFVIGNDAYVGLGGTRGNSSHDSEILGDFWKYSASSNQWTRIADFPVEGRLGTTSFSLHNRGYAGMGHRVDDHQMSMYSTFFEYDPLTDTWTETASNPYGSGNLATTFIYANKAYMIFIQKRNSQESKAFEIFDPFE